MQVNAFNPLIAILAAGNSKRFGGIKMTAKIKTASGSLTLVEFAYTKIADLPFNKWLATGAYHDQILRCGLKDIKLVNCPNAHKGIGHTISELALKVAQQDHYTHLMLCLADHAGITASVYQHLINSAKLYPEKIICIEADFGLSVPAIFPAAYFPELIEMSGDIGAKNILAKHRKDIYALSYPNGFDDIDTQEALDNWNNHSIN